MVKAFYFVGGLFLIDFSLISSLVFSQSILTLDLIEKFLAFYNGVDPDKLKKSAGRRKKKATKAEEVCSNESSLIYYI